MSSSAINTQVAQLKIGNVQNQADSTSIYSNGVWSFKNSTALPSVTIDNSGNVGIGTASPANRLHVYQNAASNINCRIENASTNAGNLIQFSQVTNGSVAAPLAYIGHGGDNTGNLAIINASNTATTFATNGTERMRLDASGNLLVGTTASVDGRMTVNANTGNSGCMATTNNGLTTYYPILFYHGGVLRGYIVTSAAGTTYTTSSDYRLKEDIKPMKAALSKVAALKPCTYKWQADGSEGEGFIAHELAEVCPSAVVGEKDAVNEDGSIKPQGIDPSRLIGLLTAAIQELSAKNDALEARLAALESK